MHDDRVWLEFQAGAPRSFLRVFFVDVKLGITLRIVQVGEAV
jgi:hypothetical protein